MFSVVVTALAGCASMAEWRDLTIDGSSEAAFGETLSQMNDELSYGRRQMFAFALVDIARTDAEVAGQAADGQAYSQEDYRRRLDGLTYDGVIALADQTGTPIARLFQARGQALAINNNNTRNTFSQPRPAPVGDDRLSGVNPGLILSDAWKEPGFSPSNFRYP
jgi:hypothetical protein